MNKELKIGVLIPTRGDRPKFLQFALEQLSRQTKQPDEIEIVNDPPKNTNPPKPDVTYRYRIGCDRLKKKGCDIIFCWEDDDYYTPTYIEKMLAMYIDNGRPEIFGLNQTVYYNIYEQEQLNFVRLDHHTHSSMMSTVINVKALDKIKWGDDNYSFVDMILWAQLKGKCVSLPNPICIGIKHGTGMCGGGGHVKNWRGFNEHDKNFIWLSSIADPIAINFYRTMIMENKYTITKYQMKPNPFLSIITRSMANKRNNLFKEHKKSVSSLASMDYEQIFIIDPVGFGMLNANTSFQYATKHIEGELVYLLDDDDRIVNTKFINILKDEVKKSGMKDVFVFKMKIGTGVGDEIYPRPEAWKSREPGRAKIGGSCFVVRKWVYEKYIHRFAYPSFGDWNFITDVLKDKAVTVGFIDELMSETGRVSRGKSETE